MAKRIIKIGLVDADLLCNGTRHPNLVLMKLAGFLNDNGIDFKLIIDQDEDGDDSLLTAKSWTILDYAGSFGGKTYLDVDMLFNNAADRQNTLSWQGSERYKEAFYLNVFGGQFSLDYYDASSQITNLGTTTAAFALTASRAKLLMPFVTI